MEAQDNKLSFKKNAIQLLISFIPLFIITYFGIWFVTKISFAEYISSYLKFFLVAYAFMFLTMSISLKHERKVANDKEFQMLGKTFTLQQTQPFTLEGKYNGVVIKLCHDLYTPWLNPLFPCLRISATKAIDVYGTSAVVSSALSVSRTPIRGNKSFEEAYYVKGNAILLDTNIRQKFMEISNAGFTSQYTNLDIMPPKKSENTISATLEIEASAIKSPKSVKKAIEIVSELLNNYRMAK